ncbi:MAG: hypothetical protein LBI90_10260 [Treponema sp.]|jgi:hypothetical protein|nr:hypothetical protein [Treponema sp.]
MTIEQTVEIPANHRLTIEVPREVPAGPVVLAFTPAGEARTDGSRDTPEYLRRKAREAEDIELFKLYAEELNREAEDVLKYQIDPFELIPPYKEEL